MSEDAVKTVGEEIYGNAGEEDDELKDATMRKIVSEKE